MASVINRFLIVVVCAVVASACGTTYTKRGLMGGVDEVQLNENTWRISARGNAYTSEEAVLDMVLLRSADIASQNGFRYFVFLSEETWSDDYDVYIPETSYSTGTINSYGNITTINTTTNTHGGYNMPYSKPRAQNIVMMFKNKLNNVEGIVYDAVFVCNTVGRRLNAQCGVIK